MRLGAREVAALLTPALLLVTVLLAIPVLYLFRYSVGDLPGPTGTEGGPPFESYVRVLGDSYTVEIIVRTMLLSLLVTVLCLIIGLPVANLLWRARARWRPLLRLVVLSPLLVSVVVSSFGWIVLLGTKGIINQALIGAGLIEAPLKLLYTNFSLVVGLTHVLLPFMVLSLLAGLEKIDPVLLDAGVTLGASRLRLWWEVILPLALPGIGAGTTFVFALAASSYVTPAVLGPNGPNFITTLIYQEFVSLYDWGAGSALSVLLLLASTLAISLYTAWFSRLGAQRGRAAA